MPTFEVFHHMPVICGIADFRDAQKLDELFLGHDSGTTYKCTFGVWKDYLQCGTVRCDVHGASPGSFLLSFGRNKEGFRKRTDEWIVVNATGPMWTTADSGITMNWRQALEWAEDLDCSGYVDWRLPIVKQEHRRYEGRQKKYVNGLATRLRLTMMIPVAKGQGNDK